LPALVNAARAFVTITAAELFWIVTAWPNGATTFLFSAIVLLLLSPKGDLAYAGSIAFALGVVAAVVVAAIIKFAVLPAFDTFPAFCLALGLYLVPAGFALACSRKPAAIAVFTAISVNVMPLIAPTNQMSYDTSQFYNSALAIAAGCVLAPLAFLLVPPLSPALRTRRLLSLALRDLRNAIALPPARLEHWEGLMYARLAALPDQAEPLQRAQLLAALSVGSEIVQLRHLVAHGGAAVDLDAALAAFAQRNSAIAIARLRQLDRQLASAPGAGADEATALRARARILVICEALSEHASYFDGGTPA
jgi:uncharacterized membrane protein YccC